MLLAQAIGRKNWTFLGSDRGGRTAAVLCSLTGTRKHHDIDPFVYLQDILRRMPSHPAGQLDELLPDVWFGRTPQHGAREPCALADPGSSRSRSVRARDALRSLLMGIFRFQSEGRLPPRSRT